MKQYYFLCGLPRAGNTLLSSIINQNSNVAVTANSIIPNLFESIRQNYNTKDFLNFPDYSSLNNVLFNLIPNYYKDWKQNIIIDRAPWGTDANLEYLKRLFKQPKFIVLHRPVLEILASFIKVEKCKDVMKRCDELMNIKYNGIVGRYYWSYQNLKKEQNVLYISYNNLIKDTKKQIDKIYKFLELPLFEHSYENLNQFTVNNVYYNDKIYNGPLHTIRTNKIEKVNYDIESYLSKEVINKFKYYE